MRYLELALAASSSGDLDHQCKILQSLEESVKQHKVMSNMKDRLLCSAIYFTQGDLLTRDSESFKILDSAVCGTVPWPVQYPIQGGVNTVQARDGDLKYMGHVEVKIYSGKNEAHKNYDYLDGCTTSAQADGFLTKTIAEFVTDGVAIEKHCRVAEAAVRQLKLLPNKFQSYIDSLEQYLAKSKCPSEHDAPKDRISLIESSNLSPDADTCLAS